MEKLTPEQKHFARSGKKFVPRLVPIGTKHPKSPPFAWGGQSRNFRGKKNPETPAFERQSNMWLQTEPPPMVPWGGASNCRPNLHLTTRPNKVYPQLNSINPKSPQGGNPTPSPPHFRRFQKPLDSQRFIHHFPSTSQSFYC